MTYIPSISTHTRADLDTISTATGLRCFGWLRVDAYSILPIFLNPDRDHDENVSLCDKLNQTEST